MNSRERVETVLRGQKPDRPPFSFWHHFSPGLASGPDAVEAHMDHLERYGLDFLKVMNDNPYPRGGVAEDVRDLSSLEELRGDEGGFGMQLDLLSALKSRLQGRIPMITTVFNVWAVLRRLVQPPKKGHNPPGMQASADAASRKIHSFLEQDAGAVEAAVDKIGTGLANFARLCLQAGADGVFLSVRDDWVDAPDGTRKLYDRVIRPKDIGILNAASAGCFNLLHVCGRALDFRRFASYPVHGINWSDRAAGPNIAEVRDWLGPAICGGIDNLSTLPEGSPEDVEKQAKEALEQAGERPIMLSAGCTYDPSRVPGENLEAIGRAARAFRYR